MWEAADLDEDLPRFQGGETALAGSTPSADQRVGAV
jgi:hypothetical protein